MNRKFIKNKIECIEKKLCAINESILASSSSSGTPTLGGATETTLLRVEQDAIEIKEHLDKKARYYFDIFQDTTQLGTPVAFPFSIDVFEYNNAGNSFRQYFIAATVVNSTAEVAALWNANVPDAVMTARDATTIWFDPRQGVDWDFGTGGAAADTIAITYNAGYGTRTWAGLSNPLVGSTYFGFREDTVLSESNLDWILIEIQRLSKLQATASKQDDIVTAINNQIDYEVIQCYGRDSASYAPWTMVPSSNTITQYVAGSYPPAVEAIVGTWDSYGLTIQDSVYYAEIIIDSDFTSVSAVEVLLDTTFITGAGTLTSYTVELRETAGGTLLDSQTGLNSASPAQLEAFVLTYDNSVTNYPELKLRLTPVVGAGGAFVPYETFVNNFQVLDAALGDPIEAIIQRVDKYENNILVSTEYFDYLGAPYTLSGTFMKDSSLQSTSLLKEGLNAIQVNTADISKLVAHNTHSSFILPLGSSAFAYVGFKELSFTVLSGSADVQVGAGGLLTYPITVASGGVITGQVITADSIDISGVQIDPTLGAVLITIKT